MSVDDETQAPAERKSAIEQRHEQAANEVLPDRRELYIGGEWVQSVSGETLTESGARWSPTLS